MRKGHIVREALGWCDYHQKLLYDGRKQAKKAARMHVEHKSTYECSFSPGLFHVGGLPESVMRGRLTRGQVFRGD